MKKKIIAAVLALLVIVPASAVLSERDLAHTLSVLRYELSGTYRNSERMAQRMKGSGERQHARLVRMMQQSNELSLMLYSQKQDYTFDMTYALNEVSRQYDEFSSRRLPFDDIVKRLDIDIDRYTRLIHTLKSLPPSTTVEYLDSLGNVVVLDASVRVGSRSGLERRFEQRENAFQLDSLGQSDRDSCIFYAQRLLDISIAQKERLVTDSTHYQQTASMLKSAYDYAQQRYKNVQNKIFIEGQPGYLTLLKSFKRYWHQASMDAKDKYSLNQHAVHSQWRGPMVVGFSLFVLFTPFHSKSYARLRKNFPQLLLGAVDAHLHEVFGDARLGGDLADGHLADLEERVCVAQDGGKLREGGQEAAAQVFGVGRRLRGAGRAAVFVLDLVHEREPRVVAREVLAQVAGDGERKARDVRVVSVQVVSHLPYLEKGALHEVACLVIAAARRDKPVRQLRRYRLVYFLDVHGEEVCWLLRCWSSGSSSSVTESSSASSFLAS